MNINVNNLDLGYEQCSDIHKLIMQEGKSLLESIETNVKNLKVHWIGNDAMIHINNLIIVYKALGELLSSGKVTIAEAANRISAIQKVRNANAGGSGKIGEELDKSEISIASIDNVEPTEQYFVDPSAATDHSDLADICKKFTKFSETFTSQKDELLSNWTEGADRDTAVNLFNDFAANSDEYEKYLTNAESELGKAIANIQKL